MGSSFVGLNGKGFWSRDWLLELFLRLLALHVDDPDGPTEPAAVIRNNMLLQSRGCFGGCVNAGLDDAVKFPGGKALVRNAINSLDERLAGMISLDVKTLSLLDFQYDFAAPIESWRLREMGRAWIALIDGLITTDASGSYPMPGCGAAPISDRPELR